MAKKSVLRPSRLVNPAQRTFHDTGTLPRLQEQGKDGRFLSIAPKPAVVVTVTRQQLRHQARMAAKAGGAA